MKRNIIILVAIVFVLGLVAVAISAGTGPAVKIKIKASDGSKGVVFDHPGHVNLAANCQECHHKDASGKETKCSGCHTKEGKEGVSTAKKALHKQCGDCHKKKGKGPQYPGNCKACHPQGN